MPAVDFPFPALLSNAAAGASDFPWAVVTLTLGMLLVAALAGGMVAQRLHLPKVTAYLIVGLVLGPQVLKAIPPGHLQYLVPLERLAMALVLFGMGCHFTLPLMRRIFRRVSRLAAGELSLTFLVVAGGLFVCYWSRLGFSAWQPAVLFGAMAMATAPATTILVLKESRAEGPVTEYVTALVAINNLAAVVLFEVLLLLVFFMHGEAGIPIHVELGYLVRNLAGSVLIGLAAGLIVSWGCGFVAQSSWLVFLVGSTTMVLGGCWTLQVPYLLTFLVMGATVANASDRPQDLVGELDRWTGLLCVIFFVIHGAELDLVRLMAAGGIGVAYIMLRTGGKYLGIYAVSGAHEDPHIRPWLGATMLSQAGAAIALSAMVADSGLMIGDFSLGQELPSIILGTVVVFELAGPILLRLALLRAGEVPVGQAIHHSTTTPLEELRLLINRIAVAFGFQPWGGRPPEDITVGQMMRRRPKSIPASATFEEVIDFIEHSHDNTYPVMGRDGELMGIIRFAHLRDALFDSELGSLVCAADLAIPCPRVFYPDDPVTETWRQFRGAQDDGLPVVSSDPPHQLVGMIKRRDLYRMFVRSGQKGRQG